MRAIAAAFVVLVAAGCAGSGPKPTAHYTTPPETTAGISLQSPRVQQIALARASNPQVFAIFPKAPGRRKCGIPEGGLHKKPLLLPGVCETSIHSAPTHEPALVVTFTEKWQSPPCPRGSDCLNHIVQSSWHIIEGEPLVTPTARLHVLATRTSGVPPPQSYK